MAGGKHRRSVSLVGAIAIGLAVVGTGVDAQKVFLKYDRVDKDVVDGIVQNEVQKATVELNPLTFDPKKDVPCPKRYGDLSKKPNPNKLWGCDHGYICNPSDRCIFEPPPDPSYECDPADCEKAPPINRDSPIVNGKIIIQLPYWPIEPHKFKADWSIYGSWVHLYKRNEPTRTYRHVRRQSNATTTTEDPQPTETESVELRECRSACYLANLAGQPDPIIENCDPTGSFYADYNRCEECTTEFPGLVVIDSFAAGQHAFCEALQTSTTEEPQVTPTPTTPPPDTTTEVTTTDDVETTPTTTDPDPTSVTPTTTPDEPETTTTTPDTPPPSTTPATTPTTTTSPVDPPPPGSETDEPTPGEPAESSRPVIPTGATTIVVPPESQVTPTTRPGQSIITYAPSGITTVWTSTRYNGSTATITSIIPVNAAAGFTLQLRTIIGALLLTLAMFLSL